RHLEPFLPRGLPSRCSGGHPHGSEREADLGPAKRSIADFRPNCRFGNDQLRLELRRGLAGPRSRRAAISSTARSKESDSTSSPARRLAFVSPSVTYGPKRPFLITSGFLLTGSSPSSRSGAAAA